MIMKFLLMHQQYLAKRNRERVRLCRERKRQSNTCVKYENKNIDKRVDQIIKTFCKVMDR
jgi:hypothetical protein